MSVLGQLAQMAESRTLAKPSSMSITSMPLPSRSSEGATSYTRTRVGRSFSDTCSDIFYSLRSAFRPVESCPIFHFVAPVLEGVSTWELQQHHPEESDCAAQR